MGRDSRIHLKDDSPKCTFNILSALNHHRWHNVKKVLPRRKNGGGKRQAAGVAASDAKADMCLIAEKPLGIAAGKQDKDSENNSVNKSSMKSRIKARISEEVSKKKGWHRRSCSCPSPGQSRRTTPTTHPESTDFDVEFDMKSEGQKFTDDNSSGCSTPDAMDDESLPKNRMCELCAAKLSMSCWKRSEASGEVKHSVESNPLLRDNIVDSEQDILNQKARAGKFCECASVSESEQLMDALDVFGPRKEFFLKILQDPGTPLLNYLQNRQAFDSKRGLTKSVSFPLAGSIGRSVFEPTNNESEQGSASNAKGAHKLQARHRPHHSVDIKLAETLCEQSLPSIAPSIAERKEGSPSASIGGKPRSPNNLPPCSPRGLKIEHENTPVIKRFKNLRKKISNAIRESRKEKQKLVMDSVFQKLPYDLKSSKDIEESDDLQKNVGCCKVDQSSSVQCDSKCFRRATTFGNSLDKYSRLFECTFNRGARQEVSEKSTLRADNVPTPGKSSHKTLERLFSLPNLRSCSTLHIDSYPGPAPFKTFENYVGRTEPRRLDEQKSLAYSVDQESQKRDAAEETTGIEDLEVHSEAPAQSDNFNTGLESTSRPSSPVHQADSNTKDITTSPSEVSLAEDSLAASESKEKTVSDSAVDGQLKVEILDKQWYLKSLQAQVDAKHKSEFNYVKDILELSGFTTTQNSLSIWHSTGQPLDPCMFEEVEHCTLITQVDSSSEINEQVLCSNCSHLLIFDLVNEVLLLIHNRSSSYYPVPLTCRSRISPMPVGCYIIGEVWTDIKWYLSWTPESYQSLDDAVGRDLARDDGWMNLQYDAECVGLEVEDMLFDDLIDEMLYDDFLDDLLWP